MQKPSNVQSLRLLKHSTFYHSQALRTTFCNNPIPIRYNTCIERSYAFTNKGQIHATINWSKWNWAWCCRQTWRNRYKSSVTVFCTIHHPNSAKSNYLIACERILHPDQNAQQVAGCIISQRMHYNIWKSLFFPIGLTKPITHKKIHNHSSWPRAPEPRGTLRSAETALRRTNCKKTNPL